LAIIQHDGVRMPVVTVERIRFGGDTPFETQLERPPARGTRVMRPTVAGLLRDVLRGVVQEGTARRAAGAFTNGAGSPIALGGKTGSGDHRVKRVGRGGSVLSARAVNRAAAFAFYLGDRHVGVLTALVPGAGAKDHHFTSALPVTLLRLLAPALEHRLGLDAPPPLILTASACAVRPGDPALACPEAVRRSRFALLTEVR
jgi:hypothetical protein